MIRQMRKITTNQRGFTLVELVVVIAILGVLAAVATPLMVNFLAGAKEEAYNADLQIVDLAVQAFFADPGNKRFLGKNQYPILGRDQTDRDDKHIVRIASFDHADDGKPLTPTDPSPNNKPDWNPLGGIQGADLTKAWTDDGDGVREVQDASSDKWTTVKVSREGVEYFTDARYYFVDIKALFDAGFLKEVPKSSSSDNSTDGKGSYTYYLDNLGRVRTLLFAFASTAGFVEGVYP